MVDDWDEPDVIMGILVCGKVVETNVNNGSLVEACCDPVETISKVEWEESVVVSWKAVENWGKLVEVGDSVETIVVVIDGMLVKFSW